MTGNHNIHTLIIHVHHHFFLNNEFIQTLIFWNFINNYGLYLQILFFLPI